MLYFINKVFNLLISIIIKYIKYDIIGGDISEII